MTSSSSPPHDVLSNLARLVSATLRDKVVLEQCDVISALQSQLESTRVVTVTGYNGSPVLARGSLKEGVFDDEVNDEEGDVGTLWCVGLRSTIDEERHDDVDNTNTVPMNQLAYIEIRIGGILYATSEDIEGTKLALGIRKGNIFDTTTHHNTTTTTTDGTNQPRDMNRSVVVEFNCGQTKTAYLTFHLTDFPKGDWRSLRSLNMHNRSIAIRNEEYHEQQQHQQQQERGLVEFFGDNNDENHRYNDNDDNMLDQQQQQHNHEENENDEPSIESMDMYHYITERLAIQHPNQRVILTSVSFNVGSVRDAVAGIGGRGNEFEIEKERYLR